MRFRELHHLEVILLGVMGSVAGASEAMKVLGSNSSSMLIRGREMLFFDGGTGILRAPLGEEKTFHVFISHYHYDHLMGLPFWSVLYREGCCVHFYGPKLGDFGPEEAIKDLMRPPFLPMSADDFRANIVYHQINAGEAIGFLDVTVMPIAVSHPGGGYVYCVVGNQKGPKIGYLSDLDIDNTDKSAFQAYLEGADFVYADTHFDIDSYNRHPDWGHSALEHMVVFQNQLSIKQLALGHHAPDRTPEQLEKALARAQSCNPGEAQAFIAYEGYRFAVSW